MSIRCVVKYNDMTFKVKIVRETTVGQLMIKIRAFIHIAGSESIYIFINNKFYCGNVLLSEIEKGNEVLNVVLTKESTFGAWSRLFVKATIKELKGLFCTCVSWSYYGLYTYEEMDVHESLELAKDHILKLRTDGHLSIELKKQ